MAFAPSPTSTDKNGLAVVHYNGVDKVNGKETRPRDLIVDEALKSIIQELKEVKSCDLELKDENKQLRSDLLAVKKELASRPVAAAASTHAPLSGYAASDSSSCDCNGFGDDANSVAVLSSAVDRKQSIMEQILEKFSQELTQLKSEPVKDQELKREVDNLTRELRGVKGRTGALEVKFKHMNNDMDDLEVAVNGIRKENKILTVTKGNGAPNEHIQTQLDNLKGGIAEVKASTQSLFSSVKFLQEDVDRVNSNGGSSTAGHNQNGWAVSNPGGQNEWGWSTSSDDKNGGTTSNGNHHPVTPPSKNSNWAALEEQLSKLSHDLKAMTQAKRKIDNCPTREGLCKMYHEYTERLDNPEIVLGTDAGDELWELRDRVVSRLAIFNLYGRALMEAKNADLEVI